MPWPRRNSDWSLTGVGPLSGLSLFDHATHLGAEHREGPLPRGGEPLPDEPPPDPSKLRFGPGVMDGIGAGAGESQPVVVAVSAILDLLKAAPSTKKVHAVAARLTEVEGPSSYDQLLVSLKTGGANRARLAELSRWLCTQGTHRQQVKAGIAMLGVSGTPDDTALVIAAATSPLRHRALSYGLGRREPPHRRRHPPSLIRTGHGDPQPARLGPHRRRRAR